MRETSNNIEKNFRLSTGSYLKTLENIKFKYSFKS